MVLFHRLILSGFEQFAEPDEPGSFYRIDAMPLIFHTDLTDLVSL